jgi:ABC-2 type transport system ATP-binding protein
VIEVSQLSRSFGARPALVDLSFTVRRGQVLGLLGPAGAGKSTAIRVLAGALRPTAGTATIGGLDAASRAARRRVGYLPEARPLPGEMRVERFLAMLCGLYGLSPALGRTRVDAVLAACRLEDWRRGLIGHLSDEARQRVALAQAVVHEPDVLVLDEPSPGTGALVAELSRERAVVLSGPRGSELVANCDRVLIVRDGRAVADGAPGDLAARPPERSAREVVVVVRGEAGAVERAVRALEGVTAVTAEEAGEGDHRLTVSGDRDDLQDAVARQVIETGGRLRELSSRVRDREEAG